VFKPLWLIASLSVTLTLIAEVAFSAPPPRKQPSLEAEQRAAQFGSEIPLCYLQTSDGKVFDLTNLCKEQTGAETGTNVSAVRSVPSPYNNANIKKFDDELYGEGN